MKKMLAIVFIVMFLKSEGQELSNFHFNSTGSVIEFKSVKMKITTDKPAKVIFDGYKDATIRINQSTSNMAALTLVHLQLAGYQKIENGNCDLIEYQSENKGMSRASYGFNFIGSDGKKG